MTARLSSVKTFTKRPPTMIDLGLLLFNVCTYNLPSMTFQKYASVDDLALLYAFRNWKTMEDTLSQDMTTLLAYHQTWRLKLSNTKTMSVAFHFNNREAKREFNVYNNGKLLPPCLVPTYLGVKLDRLLTFYYYLETLHKKLSNPVALLRRPAGSGWGGQVPRHCASLLFP